MTDWNGFVSTMGGRRAVCILGVLYVVFAIGLASVEIIGGVPVSNALMISFFVAGPGLILLYGGHRLPQSTIDPKFYPTITKWCLSAIAIMSGLLVFYHFMPPERITNPARAILVITAFVLVPAFVGGMNAAKAHTREYELEQRNQELQETQGHLRRFETIVETVNDGIYAINHDQRFTIVNEGYAEMVGYPREELLGAHISLVVDDEAVELSNQLRERLLSGEIEGGVVEVDVPTATGETIPTETAFAPLWSETGAFLGTVGIVRDITERKEHDRELERAYDLLKQTERIAAVGGWEVHPDTQEVYWSDFLFDLLEWEEEEDEPPLDEALDLYLEEDRPIIAKAITDSIESGDSFDVEARLRTKGGRVRWLRIQGVPVKPNGTVELIRGAAQDITEHKEREQELQRIRDQMEFALTASDAVVWSWDVENDMATFYPSEESLYGTTVEDWDDFISVVHPDDRDQVLSGIETALETGETKHEEIRIIRNGEIRWIEAPGKPVQAEDGSIRMIGVARDITDRKTYERKFQESNERLEQFAYAASHDLQEPLRMISSYLQLLECRYADAFDADGEEFLEFAVDGAERMRAMIKGLLAYSRVETEGNPLEPVDLNSVVADVQNDLELRISESDAEIHFEQLPRVMADEQQLGQVFQNLLKNAIEYNGDDPPRVHIFAERHGAKWKVLVRDEGIGIDPAEHDRIFDIFHRLHIQDDVEGSGIGLAVCQRIIERHGGEIWVDSQPGEGATFSFTLSEAGDNDE